MAPQRILSKPSPSASYRRLHRRSNVPSLSAVEQRLARAEKELRIQFTRIAQLQAELDRVLEAIRCPADRALM